MSTHPPLSHLDQARLDALADAIVSAGTHRSEDPDNVALPVLSVGATRWFMDVVADRPDEFTAALEAAAQRAGVSVDEVEYRGFAIRSEVLGGLFVIPAGYEGQGPAAFIPDGEGEIDPDTVYQEFEPYQQPDQAA